MKHLILGTLLALSTSAFAMDAASTFINDTLNNAEQIAALKSTSAQQTQMCSLIDKSIDSKSIGAGLLGSYAQTTSDQAGIDKFIELVPSIIYSKLASVLGKASTVSFTVGDTSTDNGDGTFSVDVSVSTGQGNYDGTAIVEMSNGTYLLVDAQYLGFSAVSYFSSTYQNMLDSAAATNPTTPVSDVVTQLEAQSGFVHCN